MNMKSLLIVWIAFVPVAYAQNTQVYQSPTARSLPAAPLPQATPSQAAPYPPPNGQQPSVSQANPGIQVPLSLKQAEALALRNNPQISVARLSALASQQVTREARSSL